jgi:hypothetical protein
MEEHPWNGIGNIIADSPVRQGNFLTIPPLGFHDPAMATVHLYQDHLGIAGKADFVGTLVNHSGQEKVNPSTN